MKDEGQKGSEDIFMNSPPWLPAFPTRLEKSMRPAAANAHQRKEMTALIFVGF
jgi:hypothetical protein